MDISTTYLGLKLNSPFIVGASPFGDDVHAARQVEDAGAGALVMRSLFEEQIYIDALSSAQASAFVPKITPPDRVDAFPKLQKYQLNPDQYLQQITDLKAALAIPLIASLNGCRPGGWIDYGRQFEAAGASAIELNLYHVSDNVTSSALQIEGELLETVALLRASVCIPVAVKLQPYYTALAHFARKLEDAGAAGIVIFNRLYQSDYDIDELEMVPQLRLSDSTELLLRLRWLALLSPHTRCSLAITGGVQNANDAIKALLAGANAVQLVSVLLTNGPRYLSIVADGLRDWMDKHRYTGIDEFRGKMSQHGSKDTAAIERGDYQRILQIWRI